MALKWLPTKKGYINLANVVMIEKEHRKGYDKEWTVSIYTGNDIYIDYGNYKTEEEADDVLQKLMEDIHA